MISQSSPIGLSTTRKYNQNITNDSLSISGIEEEEEEEDNEEQYLDASEELPEQGIKELVLTSVPSSSSDYIKAKNSSLVLLNNDDEEDNDKKPTFGRKSILVSY